MKKVLAIAGLMLAATAGRVDAGFVVDFEDVAVSSGANVIGGDITSGGFLFDSSTNHSHRVNDNFASYNGTTWLGFDDFNGNNIVTMSKVGGGAFNLASIEFTEFFNNSNTDKVFVTGNLVGGGTAAKTVVLDQIADGGGAANDFQLETFGWNVTSVVFDANNSGGDDWWAFDNIRGGAVPEPASFAMWGLGALGACVYVRRRKRQQA